MIQRHNQEKSTLELVDDPQRYASSICKQDHVREADDEGAEVPKMITKDTPVCAPRPHGMGEDAVIREGFNQRWMSQQADYQHDYSRDESVDEQLQEQEAEVSSFRTEFEQVSQNVDIRTDE